MMNGGVPGNYYMPPQPPVKEKYIIEKRDIVFAVLSILSSVVTVIFALWGGFKAGFTLSYLFLFTVMSIFLFKKDTKLDFFACVSGVLSVISSFVFGYSNNFSANFYLFIVMFFESAIWFASLCGLREGNGDLSVFTHVFATVFGKSFGRMPQTFRSLFDSKNKRIKGVGKALIGILCAVPILLFVIPLLISADGAFEGLVRKISEDIGTLIIQIVIGIAVSPFVIAYGFGLRKDAKKEKAEKEIKGIDNVFVISFLSVLAVVYLTYLLSQLAYFVDAFGGILPDEFIPSVYARRGFFEMSIIAGINFVIIYLTLISSRKKDNKTSKAVGGVCTFIILFTLFLIATAIAKMVIYIEYFGMTVLRISTSAFMVFLAIVFIAIIFRCFIRKVPVIKIALVAATCVLLVLGFGNTEKTVAEYNVNAYKNDKLATIDVSTIRNLGFSGVPALYDVYKNVPEYSVEASQALTVLYKKMDKEREIGDWTVTEQIAFDILEKFAEEANIKS